MFKCIDSEKAVVVGVGPYIDQSYDTAAEEFRSAAMIGAHTSADAATLTSASRPMIASGNESTKGIHTSSLSVVFHTDGSLDVQRAQTAVSISTSGTTSQKKRGSASDVSEKPRLFTSSDNLAGGLEVALGNTARPQVCVPLFGTGDSGPIGILGAQGFSSGLLIDDDSCREWFAARMAPLDDGDNRRAKRLKLVRPRGLPSLGKLKNVPTGTAAKVVYGVVDNISLKRAMPIYSVR